MVLDIFQKAMAETVPEVARKAVKENQVRAIIFWCTLFSRWVKERRAILEELGIPIMAQAIICACSEEQKYLWRIIVYLRDE